MELDEIKVHEKGIFLTIFGDSPILKIFDFFMIYGAFDYSMVQIARNAGVGYTTLKFIWPHLMREKIVVQTRTVGKAKLFKLNKENEIVKRFKRFYWAVTKLETDKYFEKALKKTPVIQMAGRRK